MSDLKKLIAQVEGALRGGGYRNATEDEQVAADTLPHLQAYDSLRSAIEGEVERLRHESVEREIEEASPGGTEYDTAVKATTSEIADRLQSILDQGEKE